MLFKKPTFYLAVAGTVATIVMVARLNGQSPVKPPPIDPSPNPYALSVAASGIIEALSENVAIGVPEAGLVTKVHVKVWDSIQERQPLFTLDNRELQAQLIVNEANASVASYRGTILNAFRDVEDALSDLSSLSSQSEAVNRALLSARDTAALANERYQIGLSSYLDVVDGRVAVARIRKGNDSRQNTLRVEAGGGLLQPPETADQQARANQQ